MDIHEPQKKLRIGWFTFSCCEDSTIIFTELMNDHWQTWKKVLDIRHARVLQTHNVLDELDVAFIEGALSSQTHVDRVKEIRQKSKKVVAIGACAVVGLPSTQRNQFDPERLEEIRPILEKFSYLPKAQKLSEVIRVDVNVPGCPMDEKQFMHVLGDLLKEFNIPLPSHASS
ncbi:MAG: NADH ubiquinone oxidoreductase 20 kDa subunit [Parcubacteria group bacterium GW2011_GWC2_49_9]|nr:MAG: NADH ubiquinone oxidoreductase 20 kDa subunit [Parcubacteria group bacterium GW2011_GWA2_48_9]KKW16660.1 MAG: NADH ubiquinone oxidoreductase 20 kDa subunit [Parcubacteria group bacterium GW2011_GWC2_49_9]